MSVTHDLWMFERFKDLAVTLVSMNVVYDVILRMNFGSD
jgi:hypothetical protein